MVGLEAAPGPRIELKTYNVQLAGVTISGRRTILMQGMCQTYHDWKTRWYQAYDGGSCYFGAAYDLGERKILWLEFNQGGVVFTASRPV